MNVARLYRCPSCGWFSTPAGAFKGFCPRCGGRFFEMTCTRCGHFWMPRSPDRLPKVCPACKSPYWDRARVKGRKDE